MRAMKIVVAAAAALMVGATGAQTLQDSSTTSGTDAHPWATGELWDGQSAAHASAQGAQGRSFSASSSFPADQPSQPTVANEAYDGKQAVSSGEMSSGAYGRSFSEQGMSPSQPMDDYSSRGSIRSAPELNHYHGG